MKIVVDAQLPYAAESFAALGDVVPLHASDLRARAIRDADALIVRSVTRVDRALLQGTGVRFVGSATSGTDHVDLAYLRSAGIAFSDAAGCNSTAVAEYVIAALLQLGLAPIPGNARQASPDDSGSAPNPVIARSGECDEAISPPSQPIPSLGVVGCGHVGRKVARYAAALGLRVVMNDPPLARATCELVYRPLDEVLACDIVTLHVPLEHGGPDPTEYLVNDAFLAALKPTAALINTSRGAVIDSQALKAALRSGRLTAVLDVWENEPLIDRELFNLAAIGTPHIAGHTLDARRRAVDMLVDAASKHFGVLTNRSLANPCEEPIRSVELNAESSLDSLEGLVRSRFDIADVAGRFREALGGDEYSREAGFEALRSSLPARREFQATEVVIDANSQFANTLETLVFRVTRRAPVPAAAGGLA
jgi:erythronate-4-phosphate dehydrogenase